MNILVPNFFSEDSTRALIQLPKANSDLLIFPPSISLKPMFLLDEERSDPARSTNTNLPITIFGSRLLSFLFLLSTLICKIPCEREEVSLRFVDSIVLLVLPLL